jgi:adenylate cyclase
MDGTPLIEVPLDPPRGQVVSNFSPSETPREATAVQSPTSRRGLLAVLVADVAGYTALMERAEEETYRRLKQINKSVVQAVLTEHDGMLVKHTGDGFIATFMSAVSAAHSALAIQERTAAANVGLPLADAILFRIGLNLADVIIEEHDVFGDGVNVAARLQTYAEPGGIVVSGIFAETITGHVPATIVSVGDFYPRNLSRPIQAFVVHRYSTPPVPTAISWDRRERPSIAVLPFAFDAGESDNAYFASGLIEGIIHVLSGLDELLVMSQGSTLNYSGQRYDMRVVGGELGVRYVLSGSVRRSGNRLRILTELCETETGTVASSERYDGELADLFEIQDRISGHVVANIAPHIREWELKRARRKPADSLTAYDLLLRGNDLMLRLEENDFNRARGLLQKAVAEDPNYAPAWAYSAYWHILRIGQGWSSDVGADNEAAVRCSQTALERDEGFALALAIRGHLKSFLDHDFTAASALLDRALASGPNLPLGWSFASATSGYMGDGPVAILRAERALRLSPRDPFAFRHESMLAQAHYINGNHEQAVEWGERATRSNSRFSSNLRVLIAALGALGRRERAAEHAKALIAADPGFRILSWARRTPFHGAVLESVVARLREAGLPD